MAKVLLIDDDVDLVEMNRSVLASRGVKVLAAYNSDEARAALRAERPGVVVLDVMMETHTAGFDLAREIHDEYPGLPIVMLTGVREATGVPFAFEPDETWLPVLQFLEKPFQPAELADKVQAILKGK